MGGSIEEPTETRLCPQDAEGFPIDIKVKDNGDGTYRCVYVPTKPIKHTIILAWGGVNIPKSPFRVSAMDTPPGTIASPPETPLHCPGAPQTCLCPSLQPPCTPELHPLQATPALWTPPCILLDPITPCPLHTPLTPAHTPPPPRLLQRPPHSPRTRYVFLCPP